MEKLRGENGASEGIRTLDIHLGKVMLYQLSYARMRISATLITEFFDLASVQCEEFFFGGLAFLFNALKHHK